MNRTEFLKPTGSEMEILQILWEEGDSTVREVHEILSANKESGYTTTLKLMQIMHEKGLLNRNDEARSHIYSAAIKKESMQKQVVSKMITGMFKGSPVKLIMHALGNYKASKEELDEIKKYLDEIEKERDAKEKINSKK
ncbi:MAG TPA: BlaI/MecI/CopY family transcriptional regulator [Hanamia sp.]|nr:BlaI/MecI/CopY family transcriptional regulator [Hanamia sp.]